MPTAPGSPRSWWKAAEKEKKLGEKSYKKLVKTMKKKRVTERDLEKAYQETTDAATSFKNAGDALEELSRQLHAIYSEGKRKIE